jgi:hypothetical protein
MSDICPRAAISSGRTGRHSYVVISATRARSLEGGVVTRVGNGRGCKGFIGIPYTAAVAHVRISKFRHSAPDKPLATLSHLARRNPALRLLRCHPKSRRACPELGVVRYLLRLWLRVPLAAA